MVKNLSSSQNIPRTKEVLPSQWLKSANQYQIAMNWQEKNPSPQQRSWSVDLMSKVLRIKLINWMSQMLLNLSFRKSWQTPREMIKRRLAMRLLETPIRSTTHQANIWSHLHARASPRVRAAANRNIDQIFQNPQPAASAPRRSQDSRQQLKVWAVWVDLQPQQPRQLNEDLNLRHLGIVFPIKAKNQGAWWTIQSIKLTGHS